MIQIRFGPKNHIHDSVWDKTVSNIFGVRALKTLGVRDLNIRLVWDLAIGGLY